MQRINIHTGNLWQRPRPILPIPKTKTIDLVLGGLGMVLAAMFLGLVLAAMFMIAWWMVRVPSPAAPLDNSNPVPPKIAYAVSDLDQKGALSGFEQDARELAAANSPEAFQTLFRSLKQGEPLSQRDIVLTVLQDAAPAVVPVLITALNDPDAGVRTGAAQVLGLRRESQAIAALTAATRDPAASVRREAVIALGAIDAWQVLPYLERFEVNEPDDAVRQAAMATKESFKQAIAQAIGVLSPQLRDISVTAGDVPQIYAVTTSNLYARHGTAWTLVSRLPDAPLAIATGDDPALIYLSTVSAGLYRSRDGGETWEYVTFGLQTPTRLTVTAIVIDPQNSRQVYIALASPGAELGRKDPLGISVSNDGGVTWWHLENSPIDVITTRLIIDPQWQGALFGMSLDTPWRSAYALPAPRPVPADPISDGEASE